jgi:hypothetical protein
VWYARVSVSKPQEKRLLEELGVEGMTTLKIILNNRRTGSGIYSFGSEKCPGGYGNVTVRSQYSVEPKELRVVPVNKGKLRAWTKTIVVDK